MPCNAELGPVLPTEDTFLNLSAFAHSDPSAWNAYLLFFVFLTPYILGQAFSPAEGFSDTPPWSD